MKTKILIAILALVSAFVMFIGLISFLDSPTTTTNYNSKPSKNSNPF